MNGEPVGCMVCGAVFGRLDHHECTVEAAMALVVREIHAAMDRFGVPKGEERERLIDEAIERFEAAQPHTGSSSK